MLAPTITVANFYAIHELFALNSKQLIDQFLLLTGGFSSRCKVYSYVYNDSTEQIL